MPREIAPYGSWKSPISSDLIVAETVGLSQPRINGEDIYWVEMRPSEAGRSVLVKRRSDGCVQEVTPQPFNVRTRVHEYGGGDYVVSGGLVCFSNFADQRLYSHRSGEPLLAITPPGD